jgi:hypothetical protein
MRNIIASLMLYDIIGKEDNITYTYTREDEARWLRMSDQKAVIDKINS